MKILKELIINFFNGFCKCRKKMSCETPFTNSICNTRSNDRFNILNNSWTNDTARTPTNHGFFKLQNPILHNWRNNYSRSRSNKKNTKQKELANKS